MKALRLLPPLSALILLACGSSESPSNNPTDTGVKTDSKTDGVGDSGGETAEPCTEPADERPPGSVCVKRVKGKVTDMSGKAIPPTKGADGKDQFLSISVCGAVCYYGNTTADGTFDTEVGKYINFDKFATLVHARPDRASIYIVLPKPDASGIVTIPDTIKIPDLPATGPVLLDIKTSKPTAASITSGDITLNFPATVSIDRDIEDISFDTDADVKLQDKGKTFRVVKGSLAAGDIPIFAKDQGLVALWALSPFDTKFTDGKTPAGPVKVGVSIANPDKAKLTPGMAVELVVMGDELVNTPFTGGLPQVVAKGKVSTDGSKIDTDAGEGITYMTWLGVRPAK